MPWVVPSVSAVGSVLEVLEHEGSKLPDYPWEKKEAAAPASDKKK